MAQSPLVAIATKALAQRKIVEILAACRPDWETLKTIDEPDAGVVHMTVDTDVPIDFYLPVGSISGVRIRS